MNRWFSMNGCTSLSHCEACRQSHGFRESLRCSGLVAVADFDCPRGFTTSTAPKYEPPQELSALKTLEVNGGKPVPVSREQWPAFARALALLAGPGDRGLGDVVERIAGKFGGEAFKKWHKKTFGHTCGCAARKQRWNQVYPL